MKILNCKLKIIVIVVLFLLVPATGYAQEISPTPKPVDYTLPYPGLLPDHPLYFLRAVRDSLQIFFVSDPLKKAELYLLQADKSVSASVQLAERKETAELAGATANESQQYSLKALEALQAARKQGQGSIDILRKLLSANEKHQEILLSLHNGSTQEVKITYKNALEKAQAVEKQAKQLLAAK